MSETLEERLRRSADNEWSAKTEEYASDIVELLDARDKTIAELRDEMGEYRIDLRLLNRANAAQDSVLRRKQQELSAACFERDTIQAELASVRLTFDSIRHAAHMPDDYNFGIASWIKEVRQERDDLLIGHNRALSEAKAECVKLRAEVERLENIVALLREDRLGGQGIYP